MKHNRKHIESLKLQNRLLWTFVYFCILGGLLYITQDRVISGCPEDDCSKVSQKVVYAADIEKNTPQSFIQQSKHPEQIDHIWNKETTRGKNTNPNALHNICKSQGKSNEFGYGGMAMMICFDSFEESVRVVDAWLTKRDNEALCYYNLGTRTDKCDYVK